MHNGDTIQKLAAAVDTVHERRSGNAVKTVFTNTPRPWNSEQDTTRHLGVDLIQISMGVVETQRNRSEAAAGRYREIKRDKTDGEGRHGNRTGRLQN